MSDRPNIQTGRISWSPDYDSKKPPTKLSELDASTCSAIDVTKRGSLEKALCGALRQSINAHGDITYGNAPSAAKRLIGAIKQWNKQQNERGQRP